MKYYCILCQTEFETGIKPVGPCCPSCEKEIMIQDLSIHGPNGIIEHPKKGSKYDGDYIAKPPVDLITLEMLVGAAQAHGFGAVKYGRHNFKGGIDHSRLIAAILRHMNQYNAGLDNDDESGLSHLAHAAASLNMLMWMAKHRPDLDDRYKK